MGHSAKLLALPYRFCGGSWWLLLAALTLILRKSGGGQNEAQNGVYRGPIGPKKLGYFLVFSYIFSAFYGICLLMAISTPTSGEATHDTSRIGINRYPSA